MGALTLPAKTRTGEKSGRIARRIRRLLVSAGVFCCALTLLAAYALLTLARNAPDENRMRVDFSSLLHQAESGAPLESGKLQYAFFDAKGNVLAASGTVYHKGENIDLHTLSGVSLKRDERGTVTFVSPVERGGTLDGLLLVYAKSSAYRTVNKVWILLLPFLLFCAAGTIWFLLRAHCLVNNDLLAPLSMLHDTTRRVLSGDYEARLRYDDSSETGALCHDFEAMRDELTAALRSEKELLNGDRLLLACVSHDLKTPLAAISGYAEEIRDGIAGSPEHSAALASLMLNKVGLLTRLIDDILEETKAQLGELAIVKGEVYAGALFREICGDLSLDASLAGISFTVGEIPQALLNVDRKRIAQVMQNLISNGIKYTPRGGSIDVRFSVQGRELITCVSDSGSGIAAGDLPYIFDRFYRGDAARTQNIPGSGLGLCIAKNIVERHGGRMECDSVLGSGTQMCFSLPL